MEDLEQAHQDYEKRKREIITKLATIVSNGMCKCHKLSKTEIIWLKQAIEFIKEKEV